VIDISLDVAQAHEVRISPVLVRPTSIVVEEQGVVSIVPKLLPYVNLDKTRHLLVFGGSAVRVMLGEVGTVIDYVPVDIDVSGATAASLRCVDAWNGVVNATSYVPASGAVRRVLDGTEFPNVGRYNVFPSIASPWFSGDLEPFSVLVVGELS
jgi:hypothetical protein